MPFFTFTYIRIPAFSFNHVVNRYLPTIVIYLKKQIPIFDFLLLLL